MSTTGYGLGFTNPHKELGANSLIVQLDAANKLSSGSEADLTAVTGFSGTTLLHTSSTELTCADDNRTWFAWIYQSEFGANRAIMSIGDNDGLNNDFVFKLFTVGTGADLRFEVSTDGVSATHSVGTSGGFALNEWNLVACAHNKDLNIILIALLSSASNSGSSNSIPDGGLSGATGQDFSVGSFGLSEFPFLGTDSRIDKVAVYNRAFDLQEMQEYFNNGNGHTFLTVDKTDLISFWEMSEGFGETRKDSQGNNDLLDTGSGEVLTAVGLQSFPLKNLANNATQIQNINSVPLINKEYFSFDGIDQRIIIEEDLNFSPNPNPVDLTISMWIRRTDVVLNGDIIIFKDSNTITDWAITFDNSIFAANLQFIFKGSGILSPNSIDKIELNEWTFIHFNLISGIKMVGFKNLKQIVSVLLSNVLSNTIGKPIILGSGTTSTAASPIDIALVEIDRRELTSDEIKARYNATKHRFI